MSATLVLLNGRIYTQDDYNPRVSAVAIRDGRIIDLGTDEEIRPLLANGGQYIDLGGRSATPGLVDAHVHFQGYALSLGRVNLAEATSLSEALTVIGEASELGDRDRWLLGRGWNQARFSDNSFPTAAELDNAAGQRPALMMHQSGHAAWANSRALKIADIGLGTADPPGGQIQRDSSGRPTGILFETAVNLVTRFVPKPDQADIQRAMLKAQERCLRLGLTGLHDFDGRACFTALQALHSRRQLQIHMIKSIPVNRLDYAIGVGLRSGFGDSWLQIGSLKMFADGALGTRTASMIEPYENEEENRGIIVTCKEEMIRKAELANANGISVAIHAIGDRANHDVLDVFSVIRKGERDRPPGGDSLRHRIEHAQIVHPDDFQRFADLNVIASMQPIHAISDMDMADAHWGARTLYSYAWRTMLDFGVNLAFGTDAPVEPIDPLASIYAAVTRKKLSDRFRGESWHPEQRLTVAEAVRAYTWGSAYASGRERELGSLSPGKLADLTIYSRDIFSIPLDELPEVAIDGTIVNGKFRFRNW